MFEPWFIVRTVVAEAAAGRDCIHESCRVLPPLRAPSPPLHL